jgi:hypothetical protein
MTKTARSAGWYALIMGANATIPTPKQIASALPHRRPQIDEPEIGCGMLSLYGPEVAELRRNGYITISDNGMTIQVELP